MKNITKFLLVVIFFITSNKRLIAQEANLAPKSNTRVGSLSMGIYVPQKFLQIGGIPTIKQNDLSFRGTIDITEYDSYSQITYVYKSTRLSPRATKNQSRGFSITRKKGGVYGEDKELVHFGWGMTTLGYLKGVEYEFIIYKKLYFYASTNLSAGISFSNLGSQTSSKYLILFLNQKDGGRWGNRGFGLTLHEQVGFRFTPQVGKINRSEVFQINTYYDFVAHTFWLLPFHSGDKDFSNISASYVGTQKSLTFVSFSLTVDLNKNK